MLASVVRSQSPVVRAALACVVASSLVAAAASPASGAAPPDPPGPPSDAKRPPETPDHAGATPDHPAGDALPELPPLSTDEAPAAGEDPAAAAAGDPALGRGGGASFVDDTSLAALARGVAWHGHFQLLAAGGLRGDFGRELITFEHRLQLEFESQVGPLKVVGRPQLVYDGLTKELRPALRELYAARYYEKLELSIGERILSWGVTDFWPVVDILNPRDYRTIRVWRPIDEKIPVPALRVSAVLGRVTVQALGLGLVRSSSYQLDLSRPFAVPVAVPASVPLSQHEREPTIHSAGGGASIDVALGSWKTSLHALWGRDPLPSIFARVDPATGAPEVRIENDRVAMAAASLQGTIDALDLLVKTEAAYYHRVDDRCERATEVAPGTPSCFYLRRVPTARGMFGLERELIEGLDAHVQLIGEFTRRADIPELPGAAQQLAPGLTPQDRLHPIVTLRLQGRWARGDLRPSVFAYWSIKDQDGFVNLDLEYHVADGFALAVGGFWFEGYASDRKNRFTIAGAFEHSSNAYLRATAWF